MDSNAYELKLIAAGPLIQAGARFSGDFLGFQGHFPGRPILPGFMHVQLALDVLKAAGRPHQLREVRGAKFSRAIVPDVLVGVVVGETQTPSDYDVILSTEGESCSVFTITVA